MNRRPLHRAALVLTLPLLAACTGDDGPAGPAAGAASSTSGGASSSGGAPTTSGKPAVRLGPDLATLAGAANVLTCADGYPIQTNPTFPQPLYAGGAGSCTVLTFLAPDPSAPVSTSGVVVSASLRVGPVTGKMRFVRMRLLYSNTSRQQCCSLEQNGEVFTPAANATTEVPLGFRVQNDHVPAPTDLTTIAVNDVLALEVLEPNVPVPGVWPANGGPILGTASYIYLPSLSEQRVATPSATLLNHTGSYSGFVPSFSVSYVPD